MTAVYGTALIIVLASILIGRGICVLARHEGSSWLAAPVGLAALMILCNVAIQLPGRAWTAVVVVVLACVASVWVGARRDAAWPSFRDAMPVTLIVLLLVSLPFAANGRVGVLGISYLNDTHWHLILAEGLRHPAIKPLDTYGVGYPLGPHSIAATFAQATGSDVDSSLTGLLIATPILTGLAALGLLRDLGWWRRSLVAILAAIPYMLAAAYAESAFKEPILALMMLGLVLAAQAWRGRRSGPELLLAVPMAVLVAGVIYVYSYPGLVWPAAFLAFWLGFELLLGGLWRRPASILGALRGLAPALMIGLLVLIILLIPDLKQIHRFYLDNGGTSVGNHGGVAKDALANLVAPLRAAEAFNLWLTGDFRLVPSDALQAGIWVGLAVVVLGLAVVSSVERRDSAWLGAMVAMALVYAYTKHTQSPYVASKAMMIPAPLLMVGSGAALMRWLRGRAWRSPATVAVAIGTFAFFFVALESDTLALRDAQVGPVDHVQELRSLRRFLHNRPTLVAFYDDYVKWELLGVPASSPLLQSPIPSAVQPSKLWSYGQALDLDSFDAATLDRFDYVITTRTLDQSEPPSNFKLVGMSRSYEVWRREGPTQPRQTLAESGQPGATLNCATPFGRSLSLQRGVAAVREAPQSFPMSPLIPGHSEQVAVSLPPGAWEISLPFTSPEGMLVRGDGINTWLPPNLDRPGSVWRVGVLSGAQPIHTVLTFTMQDKGLISSTQPVTQFFTPMSLVAVHDARDQIIPLHAACGRYVDWYRAGRGRAG